MNRRWLYRLLLFFLPLLVYGVLGEYYDYLFFREMRELHTHKGKLEVLITGTSQAENSVISCQLSYPSANIAFPQKHLHLDRLTSQKVLDDEPNIKTVVLELSYEHFELPFETKSSRKTYLLKYYGLNTFDRPVYPWDRLLFSKNPKQFQKAILKWKKQLNQNPDQCDTEYLRQKRTFDSLGYDRSKIKPDFDFFEKRVPNDSVFKANSTYFEQTVSHFVNKGLEVIIFIPPKHPVYHSLMLPAITNRRDAVIDKIRRQHPEIKLLDKEMDTLNFNTRDFRDQNHLNEKGAIKFTRILDSLLLSN